MPVPGNRFLPNESGFFDTCYFVRIPEAIKRARELTALEKLVWAQLAWHSWEHGRIFPAQKTLADELGTSKRSVVRALEGLRRKGYIEWVTPELTQKRHGVANEYFLIWQSSFDQQEDPTRKKQPGDKVAPVTSDRLAPESDANLANQNEQGKTKKKNEHTPTRPSSVCYYPTDPRNDEEPQNPEELTPREIGEFIQLLAETYGENPGAYRNHLKKQLKRGELSYSRKQLEKLRGHDRATKAQQQRAKAESEEQRQNRDRINRAIDQELNRGQGAKQVLRRVLRGEFLAEERDLAEQELGKRIPDDYEVERSKQSLLDNARAAMSFPKMAEKRVPKNIERLASLDRCLADQLQKEWDKKRTELGLADEGEDTGADSEG